VNSPQKTRLELADVEGVIKKTKYLTVEDRMTICVLTLVNGFVVTGESAAVDAANFQTHMGRTIAYENALAKIWMLEGYRLKQSLYEQSLVRTSQEAWEKREQETAPVSRPACGAGECRPAD